LKNKSERLKIVLDLAERTEKKAMDLLAGKRRYRDQQLEQLNSLKAYNEQYQDRIKQSMNGTLAVESLQTYQIFLSQITQAIEQQGRTLSIAQQEFDIALKHWTTEYHKRKGMSDLIARYRTEEALLREKNTQKLLENDLSARRFRR
jgi:flagellar protein FliJ